MLDPESIKFIAWAKNQLSDDSIRREFIFQVCEKALNTLLADDGLVNKLESKLTRGGQEHGTPNKYTPEDINHELMAEYLDIMGWTLVGMWCEGRK